MLLVMPKNIKPIIIYCLTIIVLNLIIFKNHHVYDKIVKITLYVTLDCIKYIASFYVIKYMIEIEQIYRYFIHAILFSIILCLPLPISIYITTVFFKNNNNNSVIYNLLLAEQLVNVFLGMYLIYFGIAKEQIHPIP